MEDLVELCGSNRDIKGKFKICDLKYEEIYVALEHEKGYHACLFCGHVTQNIHQHQLSEHQNIVAVQNYVDLGNILKEKSFDISRKNEMLNNLDQLATILRYRGDHQHNMKVLKAKYGEILLEQEYAAEIFNHHTYRPCPDCFLWVADSYSLACHLLLICKRRKVNLKAADLRRNEQSNTSFCFLYDFVKTSKLCIKIIEEFEEGFDVDRIFNNILMPSNFNKLLRIVLNVFTPESSNMIEFKENFVCLVKIQLSRAMLEDDKAQQKAYKTFLLMINSDFEKLYNDGLGELSPSKVLSSPFQLFRELDAIVKFMQNFLSVKQPNLTLEFYHMTALIVMTRLYLYNNLEALHIRSLR